VRHAIEKARRDRESAIAFVCRLMHLHQLPAVRVGPHWRFNHDSVDRWCDGRLARPAMNALYRVLTLKEAARYLHVRRRVLQRKLPPRYRSQISR
jgi:hypothetical protein